MLTSLSPVGFKKISGYLMIGYSLLFITSHLSRNVLLKSPSLRSTKWPFDNCTSKDKHLLKVTFSPWVNSIPNAFPDDVSLTPSVYSPKRRTKDRLWPMACCLSPETFAPKPCFTTYINYHWHEYFNYHQPISTHFNPCHLRLSVILKPCLFVSQRNSFTRDWFLAPLHSNLVVSIYN